MPNPLAEASAVIGYAAGFLTGSAFGWLLAKHKPREHYLRGRNVEVDWPFEGGGLRAFEQDAPVISGYPVGIAPVTEEWKPGRAVIEQLAEVVRRESYTGVPADGVRLTWQACRDAGMTRATWERLTQYVLQPPVVGYKRAGSVWLAREKCAALLRWKGTR